MLCAHMIGRLKPARFDQFVEMFAHRRTPSPASGCADGVYEIVVRAVDGAPA